MSQFGISRLRRVKDRKRNSRLPAINTYSSHYQYLASRYNTILDVRLDMTRITKKLCFITIGATASFDSLISAALTPEFLKALQASDYTDLVLQHGVEGSLILKEFHRTFGKINANEWGINVYGFDFNKEGLGKEMRAAKGNPGDAEGVVISHAGIDCSSENSAIDFIVTCDV